jgi:YD repeat-containing protein
MRLLNDTLSRQTIRQSNGDAGDKYNGLDRFGRVVDQRWINPNDTAGTYDRFQYTFDRNSNILTKTNAFDSTKNETYTYDGLNRLAGTNSSTNAYDQTWTLDGLGNINSVSTNGTPQNRTHNDENQLTVIGGSTITYDDDGNVTTDDHGNTLVYDAWNRLVMVEDGNIIKAYTYDGMGRRVTETDGDSTTDLYYAGSQVLEHAWGDSTFDDYLDWNYTFQGGRWDAASNMVHFGARDYSL